VRRDRALAGLVAALGGVALFAVSAAAQDADILRVRLDGAFEADGTG